MITTKAIVIGILLLVGTHLVLFGFLKRRIAAAKRRDLQGRDD